MSRVTVRAPAKINLFLGVGATRPDGFHPLTTVYQAVGLYEDVTVEDAPDWSVHVTGDGWVDLAAVPTDGDNIAVRAGRALAAHHGLDRAARIEIVKGIPVAGGMAGGSADAAAVLVGLDRLWGLHTGDDDLLAIAATLGSDVPFALIGGTALGTGRGEVVTPVDDGGSWWWVVVFSDEGLSTPGVYAAFDLLAGEASDPVVPEQVLEALRHGDVDFLGVGLGNDLERPAFDLRPDLRRTAVDGLEAGAVKELLSGSGPTMLFLCRDAAHAREVARGLVQRGHDRLAVVPAPVAGAHVLSHD